MHKKNWAAQRSPDSLAGFKGGGRFAVEKGGKERDSGEERGGIIPIYPGDRNFFSYPFGGSGGPSRHYKCPENYTQEMKLIKTFSKTSVVAPSVFQITSRRQKVQHSNSVDLEHDTLAMFRILIYVYLCLF